MRVRRSIPQKPLTEEQKARAIEAQRQAVRNSVPLTPNQMMQQSSMHNPISQSRMWYPYNTMNRSFIMDKKATFEEKYNVYNNQFSISDVQPTPEIDPEDLVVPPSLEEDANQASPLPPGVQNASEEDALDEYIKKAAAMKQEEEQVEKLEPTKVFTQTPEVNAEYIQQMEDIYKWFSIKELKEEYVNKGWKRDISHNNNKKSLIDLILQLIIDGASQEETDWATAGQDGSAN